MKNDRFCATEAPASDGCMLVDNTLRISVLSDRILRVERSANGVFEDRASQRVLNRNFSNPNFISHKYDNKMRIKTNSVEFYIDLKTLDVQANLSGTWHSPNEGQNLLGTARTLDGTSGFVCLEKGIFSLNGFTKLDDSKSYLLSEDGSVSQRQKGSKDEYYFAFGNDYIGGLKEFYALTGHVPLLPKYALGNWWSRYHAYTQDEYILLMDKFASKDIPFTVATIDMDWHLVKNTPKDVRAKGNIVERFQGRGWTGYTFDKTLFPDYKQFFIDLKNRGLAITMNLHPRDGIRYYEEQYSDMAAANGIDSNSKLPVEFNFTNRKFLDSYFDLVIHPYENDGVDFWWIDWQQGKKSQFPGLDPLWLLNHYHTLDAGREGRTPLILSRYAGIGSHRYPLGFSGDTTVCWKSLKFQPYFTSNASNVGYTWWSHDIGGHMFGRGNGELYVRWLQFGVFSPINRLHSSNTGFSKEPWLYGELAETISKDFLRLRHRLLPYLYTANVLTAKDGMPLVCPMYYFDKSPQAYAAKEQYYFGSELIVAPVLSRMKKNAAKVKVWLPEGNWTDIFTLEKFEGGKYVTVNCPLERIPVFAKEGAIIPLLSEREGNSQDFDSLEVRVFKGNNNFIMYDEKGSIDFQMSTADDTTSLCITPSLDCQTNKIKVVFCDIKGADIDCKTATERGENYVVIPCKQTAVTVKSL